MSLSLRKIAVYALGLILGLLLLVMAAWTVVAGPVTVGRVIRYGDTQIDDFKYYPYRSLPASSQPYVFEQAADPCPTPSR